MIVCQRIITMTCKICGGVLWQFERVFFSDVFEHYEEVCANVVLDCSHTFHAKCQVRCGASCFICKTLPARYELVVHYRTRNIDNYVELKNLGDDKCAICLEKWNKFQSLPESNQNHQSERYSYVRLECGHTFHDTCFQRWTMRSYLCPKCRGDWKSYASVSYEKSTRTLNTYKKLCRYARPS